jgi:hypothetical protein
VARYQDEEGNRAASLTAHLLFGWVITSSSSIAKERNFSGIQINIRFIAIIRIIA